MKNNLPKPSPVTPGEIAFIAACALVVISLLRLTGSRLQPLWSRIIHADARQAPDISEISPTVDKEAHA